MNLEGFSGLVNRIIAWADGLQRQAWATRGSPTR